MKTTKMLVTAIVLLMWALSCSKDDNMTDSVKVSPYDGQTNVALNKAVTLTFDSPMSGAVVQRNFHMMTAQRMQAIADSMMYYTGMMGMMTHSDSLTIYDGMMRMMGNNAMHGTFTWNSDSSLCTFDPDSNMMASTSYRMHMGREMMTMAGMMQGDGMMSDDNHGMMGNAGGMMNGDMMISFTTGTTMMKAMKRL